MKRVILGLSGGVDSSVSALLLKEKGYDVIGLYIKNFDSKQNDDDNLNDAKKVALSLGIELKVVDLVDKNKDLVLDYFIEEYKNGRTPSPCMICNKEIKFKAFFDIAKTYDADYIATGHYVNIAHDEKGDFIVKGTDLKKDQSYFLALLRKENLSKILFPIGHLTKDQVREIGAKYKIITANKKDSMDVCFVGKDKFNDFIKTYIPINKGKMLTLDGNFIKEHNGLQFYTIGQRKGLDIGGINGYLKEPWFVVGKDLAKNILYVGQGYHNKYLYSNMCTCKNVNIFKSIEIDKDYEAVFRYHGNLKKAKVQLIDNDTLKIIYEQERAVTPGQACVIYDGDILIAGGIIDKVYYNKKERQYR